MNTRWPLYLLALSALLLGSCRSLEKKAVRSVADMLSSPSGAGAFTSDDDPQLIADSLPLALKIFEILLETDPDNHNLAAATGRNFVMYSGAFVHMPADMLDDELWREADEARKRAKNLYRRGRSYLLRALNGRHEDFLALLENRSYDEAMALLDEGDAEDAYWAGLAWLGMASTDPFDMELAAELDKAALLLYRSMELDDTISGTHDVMIQLQLTLPSSILVNMRDRSPGTAEFMDRYYAAAGVGDEPGKRALYHYYRALALSEGADPSPHITMATAVSVKQQDAAGFRDYLDEALSIDPRDHPDSQLLIIVYQEKARWLLDHIEDYFLEGF